MNRVTSRTVATEIGLAIETYPPSLRRFLQCDVFMADPLFAGLALYGEDITDGRSYHRTAHVSYPWHMTDKRVTLVIPAPIGLAHTIHELAHVLDVAIGREITPNPVTHHAQTDRAEAFAEFVTAMLIPGYLDYDPRGEIYVSPQSKVLAALEKL